MDADGRRWGSLNFISGRRRSTAHLPALFRSGGGQRSERPTLKAGGGLVLAEIQPVPGRNHLVGEPGVGPLGIGPTPG
jgi:hypothetical protein